MSAYSESRPQFSIPCLLFPPLGWWHVALRATREGSLSLGSGPPQNGIQPARYAIATANGAQTLSIPIKGGRRQRLPLAEQRVEYLHDWQRQHWGALYSAYGRAPYFEHYCEDLKDMLYSGSVTLDGLCRVSIYWLVKQMRLPISFENGAGGRPLEWQKPDAALPVYHQVFEGRWGFIPNLSAIDLLMNEGPYGAQFL